jgi:hypothetical protein
MRFIPTRFHGYLDYILGAFLIVCPWLLDFAEGGAETYIPVIVGASVILYSLITDYEVSVTRRISMRTHLTLDFLGGLFLAASPWLFGFSEIVYLPHLVLGVGEMIASICTHSVPDSCPENAPCYKYAHNVRY